jgi:hypothetical protein
MLLQDADSWYVLCAMACHDRLWTRYLRGRALMAMDAAGDAVMDLSRALDMIQT